MNKKMSKRQKDIKSKLMAAICMLLVSSIMMVSSTYAWFTLSTAPEVTGITTAVGANGNLEIALQRYDGDSAQIKSESGDSLKEIQERNNTWGNIVDVSDNNIYGMSYITLFPSQLHTTVLDAAKNEVKIETTPLSTPTYGSDGRVATLESETITGVYSAGSFYEDYGAIENAKGVRAVGTASGMSARQLAYRQAVSSASTADGQARRVASDSLNTNGAALADIAINHALYNSSEPEYYGEADVAVLEAVVDALLGYGEGEAHVTGSLEYIENALRQYMLANALATASDADFLNIKTTIESASSLSAIPEDYWTSGMKNSGSGEALVKGYVTVLTEAKANATAARNALSGLTGSQITWEQIYNAMKHLINTNAMLINGNTVSYVMDHKGELAGSIMANGLNLTMAPGSGIYADIADFCGNYSASIIIPELTYEGLGSVPDVKANMLTDTNQNPVYLKAAAGQVADYDAGNASTAAATPISDFYGYIIDMAFRTNAAESYLQLQPEAANRIYDGNTNEAIMGGGASMTFVSSSDNFYANQVKTLMQSIRIVFFDTDSSVIKGYARLNSAGATDNPDGSITMEMVMTDAAGVAIEDDYTTTNVDESVAIMQLAQNTIHELSVLVYLDGNSVSNASVAYDTATSMTGSMNLQFSSSANLDPMDYTDLIEGSDSEETTAAPVSVAVADITDNYFATVYHYDGKVAAVVKSTAAGNATYDNTNDGKLTINNVAANYSSYTYGGKTISAWIIDAANAPASVVINVGADPVYNVTASRMQGITYTGSTTVDAGESLTFTLKNDTAKEHTVSYKIGNGNAVALENLPAKSGETAGTKEYTINAASINDHITIIIDVVRENFTVTAPNVDGVTYTPGATSATEGKAFNFTLKNTTATEYTVSYTVGGATKTLANLAAGSADANAISYTIPAADVTGDIEILVAAVAASNP